MYFYRTKDVGLKSNHPEVGDGTNLRFLSLFGRENSGKNKPKEKKERM
jgi:hypothetical protein